MSKLVIRASDGAVFEPSCPDNYDEGQALIDLFSGINCWYFRQLQWKPRRWWQLYGKWKRTGEIWKPKEGREFDVVTRKQAIDLLQPTEQVEVSDE